MSSTNIKHLAKSIGLISCLYAVVMEKLKQNFTQVSASPPFECAAEFPEQENLTPIGVTDDPYDEANYQAPSRMKDSTRVGLWASPTTTIKESPEPEIPYLNYAKMDELGVIFPFFQEPSRKILEASDHLVCYDNKKKVPVWTLERLTPYNSKPPQCLPKIPANKTDTRILEGYRSCFDDYCASLQRRDFKEINLVDPRFHTEDLGDATLYSNVVPQALSGYDPKSLTVFDELYDYIRYLIGTGHHIVYVITGTLYLPQFNTSQKRDANRPKQIKYTIIGRNKIAVPTHFYKVILTQKHGDQSVLLECYLFENKYPQPLDIDQYFISRKALEKLVGFQIFPRIDEDKVCRSSTDPAYIGKRLMYRLKDLRHLDPSLNPDLKPK